MNLTKRLAKNQVCAIFHMRDIRKNVPKSVETPCWCPLEGHKSNILQETSVFEFFYKCISPSLDELIKIKVIFILRQRMISLQISKTR